jgi:hypothetical protein
MPRCTHPCRPSYTQHTYAFPCASFVSILQEYVMHLEVLKLPCMYKCNERLNMVMCVMQETLEALKCDKLNEEFRTVQNVHMRKDE